MALNATKDDPDYWRNRAKEARAIAVQMVDAHTKATMLAIAQDYEKLARRAYELATRPRRDQSERFVERRVSQVLHRQSTRHRFLQRQKIPPGEALLQWAAQQKGRMKRG